MSGKPKQFGEMTEKEIDELNDSVPEIGNPKAP